MHYFIVLHKNILHFEINWMKMKWYNRTRAYKLFEGIESHFAQEWSPASEKLSITTKATSCVPTSALRKLRISILN